MSSTRTSNDDCAYKQRINESTRPLNYVLYPGKYYNCSKCRIELGQVGGNGVALYSGNMVDLESNLMGVSQTLGKCNQQKNTFNNKLIPQNTCQMVDYSQVVVPENTKLNYCDYNKR